MIAALLLISTASAATPTTTTPQFKNVLLQSKQLLAQGQRKKAVALLNTQILPTQKKAESKELIEKRKLFSEQFLSSDSFQIFQEAKEFAELDRFAECARELEAVPVADADNTLVLQLKGYCQKEAGTLDAANKSYTEALTLIPTLTDALLGTADIAARQNKPEYGLAQLALIETSSVKDKEAFVIIRARLLELAGRVSEAIEELKKDQEQNLERTLSLFELGALYSRTPKNDWYARKNLLLFIGRCKKYSEPELKRKKLEKPLTKAKEILEELEQRLQVKEN